MPYYYNIISILTVYSDKLGVAARLGLLTVHDCNLIQHSFLY